MRAHCCAGQTGLRSGGNRRSGMNTPDSQRAADQLGETRMLIGGELVEAASGARFDNVNPATARVIGQVADASIADMGRAIGAARKAFDESDWSTNRALRGRVILQLAEALLAGR